MTDTNREAHTPLPWEQDVQYLARLADWAAGQGLCEIEGLEDPEEWCFDAYDRVCPEKDGEGYSADALAAGLIASIVRACNSHYQLVSALQEAIEELWDRDHSSMDRIQFERANASLFTALSQAGGE